MLRSRYWLETRWLVGPHEPAVHDHLQRLHMGDLAEDDHSLGIEGARENLASQPPRPCHSPSPVMALPPSHSMLCRAILEPAAPRATTRPRVHYGPGSSTTTSSASPWRCGVRRRPSTFLRESMRGFAAWAAGSDGTRG